ncbi:zinc ribbon domain-containing protein [Desulfohalobiaceae bacterium Ax17]|jgi:putative FmdB family regulatory protein|uniref:FmdB family zinc ribbon protein n=1 Tax=Desulfovulcanus ferrireducens TaxID=2831190 RepID=UPI00207B9F6E|nr:zinc ribbon domain-containing protein [Desulfovulcanus ferrireducens]MBT8763316.1 zinc ribbon domain-containing protein [Desulfovulcanus ferrireducens]
MPIYEYRCNECQQVFEEWQKDFEERDVPCPICGGSATRLISHSAFILKGSGWYVTDYCNRKSSSNNGKKEKTTDQKGQTATSKAPANSSATQNTSGS